MFYYAHFEIGLVVREELLPVDQTLQEGTFKMLIEQKRCELGKREGKGGSVASPSSGRAKEKNVK